MVQLKYIAVVLLSLICMNNIYADDSVHTNELSFDMNDYDKHMGIAAFQKEDYTKAIYYLEKYFKRQPNDECGADYLYGAYLRMNRTNQAKTIFPYLSAYNKSVYIVRPKPIAFTYAEGGMLGKGIASETKTNSRFIYPKYKNGGYGLIQFGHNLSPQLSYTHHFSFYTIKGIQKIEGQNYNLDERQLNYTGSFQYCLTSGLTFNMNGAYINDKYSIIKRDDGAYTTSTTHRFKTESETEHSYAIGIATRKSFDWFYPELFCSYAKIFEDNVWQPQIQFNIFPFRNLNLYGTTTFTDVCYKNTNNFIIEQRIGGKATPWLWLETAYAYGNMKYYIENDFTTLYTMLNKSKHRITFNADFPIATNISLNLLYRFMTKENSYSLNDKDPHRTYTQKSNSHNIIGGIKCTF